MQAEIQQTTDEEISLKDIVNFFKDNQKIIVLCEILGLLISSTYVIMAPREYEALWQMQVAQLGEKNIEEPASLAERLRPSSVYPIEVQQSCGMPSNGEIGDNLNKKLVVKPTKDLPNAVQFKIRAASVDQAKQCAEALVILVKAHQQNLIEESLAGRQEQLAQYQLTLKEELQHLEKIETSALDISYLAKLDNLRWLHTRIDALQEESLLSLKHPAKLTVPIYASSKSISPNVMRTLLLGMLAGLMLGLLFALAREGWRKIVE